MKWTIAFFLVVGVLAWSWWAEQTAETSAREFCDAVTVGTSFAEVAEIAKTAGEDQLRFMREESIFIGFTGIPPFSRHACDVRGEGGKVVTKRYVHLD